MYLYGVVKMPPCQDEVFCKDLSNYHWTIFISFPHSTKPTKCTIPNQWLQQYPIHQRRGSEMIEVIRQRVKMLESNAFLSKVQRTSDFRGNQTFYTCASGPWTAHDETWKIQILVITTVYKLHRSGNIFPVCLCSEIDLWVAKHCVCSHL